MLSLVPALFPVLQQIIQCLIQGGFHALLQNSGQLGHQPVLLFLLFLFAFIVSLAHFLITSILNFTFIGVCGSRSACLASASLIMELCTASSISQG